MKIQEQVQLMEDQQQIMAECGGIGRVYRAETSWWARSAGGGTGNPGGYGATHTSGSKSNEGNNESYKGNDGTGGLLIIYCNEYDNIGTIESNGIDSADYSKTEECVTGGASGGGSINIFYNKFIFNNILTATGGESKNYGGAGGDGSITAGSIFTGEFIMKEME